jgi:hypothetical protein
VVIFFHDPINRFHAKTEGVFASLAIIVAIYVVIGEYYYLKSERFYLWVQRQILRWRRAHTYWRFTVRYTGVSGLLLEGKSEVPELQRRILAAFANSFLNKPMSNSSLTNSLSVTVDDIDRFDFSFDFDSDEITLLTSKMRVPSNIYWSFMDTLVELLDRVEKAIGPRESQYRLEMTFETNPYFGFFVRHVGVAVWRPRQMQASPFSAMSGS